MGNRYFWNKGTVGGIWSTAANWTNQATNLPATAPPGAGDTATIDGGTSFVFQILAGSGTAAVLQFLGNTALEGNVSAGTITLGAGKLAAPYAGTDAVTIQAGVTLAASATLALDINLEADGTSAALATTGATQGSAGGANPDVSEVLVLNGARVTATQWTLADGDIYIDASGSFEIGTAGGAAAGRLTIDKAASFAATGSALVNNAVTNSGTIAVGPSASLDITGAVTGAGGISVSTAGSLSLDAGLSGAASVSIAASGSLTVGGTVSGVGKISLGNSGLLTFGTTSKVGAIIAAANTTLNFNDDVTAPGAISVGASGHAYFAGNVTGRNSLSLAAGASASFSGTVAGLSQITLAAGAAVGFFQTAGFAPARDLNVPIVLSSQNLIQLDPGDSIAGVVKNFNATDLIANTSVDFDLGGLAITAAIWSAGANGTGTLTLSSDGAATDSLLLAGSYTGQQFLTNDVLLPSGTTDIALAGGTTTGLGATGAVTGATGSLFRILAGTGSTASLSFVGNTAVEGVFHAGTLQVGGSLANTVNATDIETGGTIAVTGAAVIVTGMEVDGSAALLSVAGTLELGGGEGTPELYVQNGGRVVAGALLLAGPNGSDFDLETAVVWVDKLSSLEVGTAGTATGAGTLTIDAGALLEGSGLNVSVQATAIIDNGTIEVAPPTFDGVYVSATDLTGDVSGTGQIDIGSGLSLFITGNVTGLSAIDLNADSSLTITGSVTGQAAISQGNGSGLTIEGDLDSTIAMVTGAQVTTEIDGDLSGLTRLEIGAGGSLHVSGAMTNVAVLAIDNNGSATIDGTVSASGGASSQIDVAASVTLDLFGNDTNVPVVLSNQDVFKIGDNATIGGVVHGFNSSDLLDVIGSSLSDGGTPITAATLTGTGAGQTLVLSNDGVTVSTILLAGNYAGTQFLTNFVNLADGYSAVTLPGRVITGVGTGGTISGDIGSSMQVITGSGSVTALNFIANNALEGSFTATSVTVGGTLSNSDNVLDIETNATLTATGGADVQTGLELDGAGALLVDTGRLAIGGGPVSAEIDVVNHASLRAAGIAMTGDTSGALDDGALLLLDTTASVTLGSGVAAASGDIQINADATLSSGSLNDQLLAQTIIDNGVLAVLTPSYPAISVSALQVSADIAGTGTVTVADGTNLFVGGKVTGLSGMTIGANASLDVTGDMTNVGPLVTGTGSTAELEGAISGLTSITVGASASLTLVGAVSGSGSISIGAGATAEIDSSVVGLSGITLGSHAKLILTGSDTNVPIFMAAGSMLEIGADTVIGGLIHGFARGDLLQVLGANDGTIITAAVLTPGAGGVGALVLSDDGKTLDTLHLAGSFAGQQFLTNAAGVGGLTDITLAPTPHV